MVRDIDSRAGLGHAAYAIPALLEAEEVRQARFTTVFRPASRPIHLPYFTGSLIRLLDLHCSMTENRNRHQTARTTNSACMIQHEENVRFKIYPILPIFADNDLASYAETRVAFRGIDALEYSRACSRAADEIRTGKSYLLHPVFLTERALYFAI